MQCIIWEVSGMVALWNLGAHDHPQPATPPTLYINISIHGMPAIFGLMCRPRPGPRRWLPPTVT
uniref:Uncharacterized protein n=1 Tax=Oryza sativa subsp. japonica TaxID=39947 RepID=Q6ZBQ3_ORYSJ|nr:hypothetical protein [Oryza sativa Japonica Group]